MRPLEALELSVPDDVPLSTLLPGTNGRYGSWCKQHDRECHWVQDPDVKMGKWFHVDDGSEMDLDVDSPTAKENKALFDLLLTVDLVTAGELLAKEQE